MCKKEKVIKTLLSEKITVATAESCTGGLLAAAFTDYAGISEIFMEGAVTYANAAKVRLGVSEETLAQYGAVSHETACEMARRHGYRDFHNGHRGAWRRHKKEACRTCLCGFF